MINSGHGTSCLAWGPLGKVLCGGSSDGFVSVYNVENGETLCESKIQRGVTSVSWAVKDSIDSCWVAPSLAQKNMVVLPSSFDADAREEVDHTPRPWRTQGLQLVAVGDSSGAVTLLFAGSLPVLRIDAAWLAPGGLVASVDATAVSPDLSRVAAVVNDGTALRLALFGTDLLAMRAAELQNVGACVSEMLHCLAHLDGALALAADKWRVDPVAKKFEVLAGMLRDQACRLGPREALASVLMGAAVAEPGFADALSMFFGQHMVPTAIGKLQKQVASSLRDLAAMVDRYMLRASRALEALCAQLRGLCCWKDRYEVLGLDERTPVALVAVASELSAEVAAFGSLVGRVRRGYADTFAWMKAYSTRLEEAGGAADKDPNEANSNNNNSSGSQQLAPAADVAAFLEGSLPEGIGPLREKLASLSSRAAAEVRAVSKAVCDTLSGSVWTCGSAVLAPAQARSALRWTSKSHELVAVAGSRQHGLVVLSVDTAADEGGSDANGGPGKWAGLTGARVDVAVSDLAFYNEPYLAVACADGTLGLLAIGGDEDPRITLGPVQVREDSTLVFPETHPKRPANALFAKSRQIPTTETPTALTVSGPRGTAAVICHPSRIIIFDLEDDEDENNEDEGGD
jgi:hypothetical protein